MFWLMMLPLVDEAGRGAQSIQYGTGGSGETAALVSTSDGSDNIQSFVLFRWLNLMFSLYFRVHGHRYPTIERSRTELLC